MRLVVWGSRWKVDPLALLDLVRLEQMRKALYIGGRLISDRRSDGAGSQALDLGIALHGGGGEERVWKHS